MTKTCAHCGETFEARSARAKYCGSTCRARASEKAKRGGHAAPAAAPAPVAELPAPSTLAAAVRGELEAAERLGTFLGAQAVALAGRIDAGGDTGSAVAALSKELRAVMDAALAGAPKAADALDELANRRRRKASGA
ncbi:hypothetical protein GCM10010182_67490 [Actinomadura cremea]|nr:hypothetical protein GCM10010182_67490 [Actinomadura cremea]